MEETVQIVRALFAEQKVAFAGRIFPKVNYDFWFTPFRNRIPIYLAALNPKMLDLCGRIADGTIMVWATVGRAKRASGLLKASARKAGRNPSGLEVASLIPTCVSEDEEAALDGARKLVGLYTGFYPRYNRLVAESGFPKKAREIRQAWLAGRTEDAFRDGGREDGQGVLHRRRQRGLSQETVRVSQSRSLTANPLSVCPERSQGKNLGVQRAGLGERSDAFCDKGRVRLNRSALYRA